MRKMRFVERFLRTASSCCVLLAAALSTPVASADLRFVEYIQGSGAGTTAGPWIETDYTPHPQTDRIVAVVVFPSVSDYNNTRCVWCARGTTSSKDTYSVFAVNINKYYPKYCLQGNYGNGLAKNFETEPPAAGRKYELTFATNVFTQVNEYGRTLQSYAFAAAAFTEAGGPMTLFASYVKDSGGALATFGNYSDMRLYLVEVYRNGELLHKFVPCVRDGVPTLFDAVTDKATVSNRGDGAFTAGPELSTVRLNGNGELEYAVTVTAPSGKSFTVNGTAYVSSAAVWATIGAPMTLVAEVGAGEKIFWTKTPRGATVSGNTVTWSQTEPVTVDYKIERGTPLDGYVQDGLVGWWDALNNQGRGLFDATASTWCDLTANGNDYAVAEGCTVGASGGFELTPGKTAVISAPATQPTFLTVDACLRWEAGLQFFIGPDWQYRGLFFSEFGSFGAPNNASAADKYIKSLYASSPYWAKAGETATFAVRWTAATLPDGGLFKNGFDCGGRRVLALNYWKNTSTGTFQIGSGTFRGAAHALRLYSRQLGEDELRRNAVIDAYRFANAGLPDDWNLDVNNRFTVQLSFATDAPLTVTMGDTVLVSGAVPSVPLWLPLGTNVTVTATPAASQTTIWNGLPSSAVYSADGNTVTFALHVPHTVECELLAPNVTLAAGASIGTADYSGQTVYVPAGTVTGVKVTADRLVLGGGPDVVKLELSKTVDLSGDLDLNRNATLSICTNGVVGGSVRVRRGAKMTHPNNGDVQKYKIDLAIAGDMTVEEGGKVNVDSAGRLKASTRPAGTYSIVDPWYSGFSGGANDASAGGGVVRLAVGGTLTVDGEIASRGVSMTGGITPSGGCGGSVKLVSSSLAGHGLVCADGGSGIYGTGGTGGAVALYLTGAGETFDAFDGLVSSAGGANTQYESTKSGYYGRCGPVYMRTADAGDYGTLRFRGDNVSNLDAATRTYTLSSDVMALEVSDLVVTNYAIFKLSAAGAKLSVHGDVTATTGAFTSTKDAAVEFVDVGNVSHLLGKQTYGKLVCETPGKEIRFDTSATNLFSLVADGALTVAGAEGNPVSLLPEVADGTWTLANAGAGVDVRYAAISNSALSVSAIAFDSEDLGGNANWKFKSSTVIVIPGEPIRWTGASSAQWADLVNWDLERAVAVTDDVHVYGQDELGASLPYQLSLVDAMGAVTQSVNNLSFERKAAVTLNGATFAVTNLLKVADAVFTVKGTVPLAVTNAEVAADGLLVVDGGTLAVSGPLTVKGGGTLVVTNGGALAAAKLVLEADAKALFVSGTVTAADAVSAGVGAAITVGTGTLTAGGDFSVETGASVSVGTGTMTVGGELSVASGACLAENGAVLNLAGDATFGDASAFASGGGLVTVNGTAAQRLSFGGVTFDRLVIDKVGATSADNVVEFTTGFAVTNFTCETTRPTAFAFGAGETFAFGELILSAQSGGAAMLTLKSTSPGTCWNLTTAESQVFGVTVADSDASSGSKILTCAPSSGNGNCPNWDFEAKIAGWQGAASGGSWSTAANWTSGAVPDADTIVKLNATNSLSLTIPAATSVKALYVAKTGGGTVSLAQNGALTVAETLELGSGATLTAKSKEPTMVGGDVFVRAGATITHAENKSAENYSINLVAGGDVMVEAGGRISANGKGYDGKKGPTVDGKMIVGAHGGSNNTGTNCYDSVFAPVMSGAGGEEGGAGGGVVFVSVAGRLTVDGTVSARGEPHRANSLYSTGQGGAGGSVWLRAGSFAGSGTIDAVAGYNGHQNYKTGSGGGRIAVELTDPSSDFSQWTGKAATLFTVLYDLFTFSSVWYYGGCGTVWFGWTAKNGTLTLGGPDHGEAAKSSNNYTDLPMADDGKANRAYSKADIVLDKRGKLRLTDDLTVRDLDFRATVGTLNLNGRTLTIRSTAHKNGKGWAAGWEERIVYGTNPKTGEPGRIVWKQPGMMLIVR